MNKDNKSIKSMIESIKVNRLQSFDLKQRNKNLQMFETPKNKRLMEEIQIPNSNMSLYSIMHNSKRQKSIINSLRRHSSSSVLLNETNIKLS